MIEPAGVPYVPVSIGSDFPEGSQKQIRLFLHSGVKKMQKMVERTGLFTLQIVVPCRSFDTPHTFRD